MKKATLLSLVFVLTGWAGAIHAKNLSRQPASDLTACTTFTKAVPVWAEGRQEEQNVYLNFRQVLEIGKARKAIVRLTASADYRMKVNGEFVAHGPSVAAHGFYRIDAYDLTPMLKPGKNVLAIEVAGYNVESYYLLKQPSFLQAEVEVDGKVVAATGDDAFKAYESKQRKGDTDKFSFQRPTAEEYVLTPSYKDWASQADWQGEAVKLARQEDKALLERGVAYPDYTVHAATLVRDGIFKFNCNSTGFIGAKVHVSEPSRLKVGFDEILWTDGHVNCDRLGTKGAIIYDLEPGDYMLESFEPYTMQFVEYVTEKGKVDVDYVYMRDYCGSDVKRARFESDDMALNRLFEAARETHRQNALDVFMDCPSRERAGWLCDSYFSSRVAFDMSGNTRIEHNFLQNFLLPKEFKDIDKGMLPMCYPSDHGNHNYIPNWAMWFVLELEEYLHRSGDHALVDLARERVYGLIDYFKPYLNQDGLLEKLSKWVFLEWSDANKFVQDVNYPSNMLYAKMLETAGNLYKDEALKKQAEQVRREIRKQAYDGRFFCDNALRQADGTLKRTDNHTEACQYYAFYLQTATPETYPELWKKLRDEFGPGRKVSNSYPDVPFANAFIGNYLRLEILSQEGLSKQLMSECQREYSIMANMTGTLWENMTTVASCNHGFAAHIERVLMRDILGIRDVSPTEKRVTLRFTEAGVKHCKGTLPVGDEDIQVEWHMDGGKCLYKLTLPTGYKAVIDKKSMPCQAI